jgi:NADH:ubiquinone reductase (H+-translocating)
MPNPPFSAAASFPDDLLPTSAGKPRIVVLGAGFGGLAFCRRLPQGIGEVILVDRENHHLFQPLLYQVATAGLTAPSIAQPIRAILRHRHDVTCLMGEVKSIDLADRRVRLDRGALHYDFLVIALGGVNSYFGHDEWANESLGLKTLDDALLIRRRVLLAFERAEAETDPAVRERLLTFVVVGGGPTGVEMAGALAELARRTVARDFRRIDLTHARVILIEAGPRLLPTFPEKLSASAQRQLERLGVTVHVSTPVSRIGRGKVELADGPLCAETIIWAAGVAASPLTRHLGLETDRAGRLKVEPDLSLPGHPEAFAIGDLTLALQDQGRPVPGVAPAAMQMGRHAADRVAARIRGVEQRGRGPAFRYKDKGSMATIGRASAVVQVGRFQFSGFFAWVTWLFVHLIFLVGFAKRLVVFASWIYSYATYKRGARLITGVTGDGSEGRRPLG